MSVTTLKNVWSVVVVLSALLSASMAQAQDPAPAPANCARDLDDGAIKDVIQSNSSIGGKTQRVVDIAKGSVINKWSSIARPEDVESALSDVARKLIAKVPAPLPTADADATAKALAKQLGDALNAACLAQNADAAALRSAALAAAQIPEAAVASAGAAAVTVDIKSSGDAYGVGDRLRFATETDGFSLVKDSKPTEAAVAPCGAKFRVTNVDKSGENVIGYFYSVPKDANDLQRVGGHKCHDATVSGTVVIRDKDYQITADRLARAPAYASGYQFGVLVAPYKFHFSDDSTTPSATVGGYFGFQYGSPSVSVTPVFSVGLGAVTETRSPDDAEADADETESTLATLSAAAGVLFTIRKAGGFTVGLLIGSDWTGQKERYRYDGKLWAAVSVGMSITN